MITSALLIAAGVAIEPRAVQWQIVSDREMARLCTAAGLRANCEGMASWSPDFRQCIIWTRSPRAEDDASRWRVVWHELRHCQDGHFHAE